MIIKSNDESLSRNEVITQLCNTREDLIRLQRVLRKQTQNQELDDAFRKLFPVLDELIYTMKIM